MIISGNNVWINEEFIPSSIVIENGKIKSILPKTEKCDIDYQDNYIIPGMIDVHTHGYGGGDASDGNPDTIRKWAEYLPKEGVTAFLPGTVTRSEERIMQALRTIAGVIEEKPEGAQIYGIFLQGPYTSHEYPGAYDPYLIRKPDVEQFKRFCDAAEGHIKRVGLAVEKDEGHRVLKYAVREGIKVSIGFSGCSYEEAVQAADEGVTGVTHCFNAMNPLRHREPGLPGAALTTDALYTEVIADGIHIHPAVINLIGKMKGKDRLMTITVSSRYKGLPPGYYESIDRKVTIGRDGVGRLPDGRLAGCCITMAESVRNLKELGKLSLAAAINSATINPAAMLGIGDRKGLIKEGYDADIAVCDAGYGVVQTYCRGKKMI